MRSAHGLDAGRIRAEVLAGIAEGRPRIGPQNVHIDVTNGCNAACITCWDHSPLLDEPRPAAWKRQRLSWDDFARLTDQLDALGSVRAVVLSGMGEPLTHPRIWDMIARIQASRWHLTVLSNVVAAEPRQLADAGIDTLLVGVHGATPAAYTAFHPGWTEEHFFKMCKVLRSLSRTRTAVRHVQVIDRNTAPEVPQMVRFGRVFRADRVNFKLASLAGGTEATGITPEQREALLTDGIPRARALADELGVHTNLELFESQVQAAVGDLRATTPMDEVGCYMGYVYTRVAVDGTVLFCCNTEIEVGHLDNARLEDLWTGPVWQGLRSRIAEGRFFDGCARCGKYEQNVKWSERARA